MDNIVLRLNTKDADDVSSDNKNFTFYFNNPIILNDEYDLILNELVPNIPATIVSVILSDLQIYNNQNYGFHLTTQGLYRWTDPDKGGIFTIRVYTPPGYTTLAELVSVSNMNNYNVGDEINIYNDANRPTYLGPDASGTWNKTGQSGALRIDVISSSQITKTNYKLNVKMDSVKYKNTDYISSDKSFTPYVVRHNLINNSLKLNNYGLVLLPQVISSIKLNLESSDGEPIETNQNVDLCFILIKKNNL